MKIPFEIKRRQQKKYNLKALKKLPPKFINF